MTAPSEDRAFEDRLEAIEQLVRCLEEGKAPLAQAKAWYQRVQTLAKEAQALLDAASAPAAPPSDDTDLPF